MRVQNSLHNGIHLTRKRGIPLFLSTKTRSRRLFRDDVVDYLIDCILNRRFLPGDKVLENQVAAELAIGKGAVREALRDLVSMGFLEAEPYKGTRVRLCSVADLHHYCQARIDLVKILTDRIFRDGKGEGLNRERMRNLLEGMENASREGQYLRQVKLDLAFHRVYAEGAENPYLLKAWNSLEHYYWVSLYSQAEQEKLIHHAERHYHVLDAIDSGNTERVLTVQIENLQTVIEQMEPVFVGKGLLIS